MSEIPSSQDASSKPSRGRKTPAKKPRKSRSAKPEAGTQAEVTPAPLPQAESAPIAAETAPQRGIEIRSIQLTPVDKAAMIAKAAYYRAEKRRFAAGHELEDWLAAEAEIEDLVRRQHSG